MVAPVSLAEPRGGDGIRIHAIASYFAKRCELTLVGVETVNRFSSPLRPTAVVQMRKNGGLRTVARALAWRLPYESARFTYQIAGGPVSGPFDVAYLHLPQAWDMWSKLTIPRAQVNVIDLHNDDCEIWRHRAIAESKQTLRIAWHYWMRRSEVRIRRLVDSADLVFCVSDADRASLVRREGARISSKVFIVPNGVDVAHFEPPKGVTRNGREMIFVGSLDARRNQDAARRLLTMWPAIARSVPGARLSIVGRNPPGWLLANRSPSIEIVASPADVRPYLWRATALLAPFETGGGTKIKVIEAMAAGTPIIATRAALEGLPALAGRHYLEIGNGPEAPAAVVRAFEDEEGLAAISREASQLVRELDWSAITARALDLISRRLAAGA